MTWMPHLIGVPPLITVALFRPYLSSNELIVGVTQQEAGFPVPSSVLQRVSFGVCMRVGGWLAVMQQSNPFSCPSRLHDAQPA
jgi:hypothetical protein